METTPTQAVEAALAAITAQETEIGAFATVLPAHAREQARHLEAMLALGMPRGPLTGMVVGVKDIIDVAGLPTGGGSRTREGVAPAARDAAVVQRLCAAGAVMIGKTKTVEYAFGGWGTNVSMGTPRNPRDRQAARAPGGSSSGSGAAVAAGMVAAALGTDTGGSVRLPASFCGVVGLKTTAGLLPNRGVLPLSPRLDTVGPLAATVLDAARVFAALLAEDAPRVAGGPALVEDPALVTQRGVGGMRIGVPELPAESLHADTARVFAATRDMLAALGAAVRPAALPQSLAEYATRLGDIMASDAYRAYGALAEAEPNRLGAPVRERIRQGHAISAPRLLAALEAQAEGMQAAAALFEEVDALLLPTTPYPAPKLDACDEAVSPGGLTRFVNFLGLAAVSLPMGRAAEGMPVAMQIVVPPWHEVRALVIAGALERAAAAQA